MRHTLASLGRRLAIASAALTVASFAPLAHAAKTELLVYSALEADQIKAYKSGFEKAHPEIELKFVRDSTGIITARLLADSTKMTAEIPVTERLLTDLAPGEKVTARFAARPLESTTGALASVAPATAPVEERKDGTLRPPERPERFIALAEFDNADGRLLPRMAGTARI